MMDNMIIKKTFKLETNDLTNFQFAHLYRFKNGIIFGAAALASLIAALLILPNFFVAVAFFILPAAYLLFTPLNIKVLAYLNRHNYGDLEVSYEINKDEIIQTSNEVITTYVLADILSIKQTKNYIYIYYQKTNAHLLPKQYFSDDEIKFINNLKG